MNNTVIQEIIEGNREIFLEYYNKISVSFMKYIFFRAGGDMDLAESVFQESFTRLLKSRGKLAKLASDDMLFPWICGVANRILADHFRGKEQKNIISLESLDPVVQESLLQIETEEFPRKAAEHPQIKLLVGMVMSSLKPTYAEALKAKYCDGLSVKEIARKMGSTVKIIEGQLYRARTAFREVFKRICKEIGDNNG